MSSSTPNPPVSFHFRIIRHKDRGVDEELEIGVDGKGKEEKPADWRTLGVFIGDGQESLKESELIQMIPVYEMKAYGTASEQTSVANKLWLRDDSGLTDDDDDDEEGKSVTKPYREYGWAPATISIEPNERKKHEKWKTKKKILHVEETKVERCVLWDPSKDDDSRIEFVSYFLRSGNPIFGQGFAPPITFEFRGFTKALGLCVLPTNDATPQRHTMDWVFKHHGVASPRNRRIEATRHTVRAKLKYEVRIAGVAAGDCGERGSRTTKYRQFPIDFIFEHNGISPITEMYEDVELVYFTNIDVLPIK